MDFEKDNFESILENEPNELSKTEKKQFSDLISKFTSEAQLDVCLQLIEVRKEELKAEKEKMKELLTLVKERNIGIDTLQRLFGLKIDKKNGARTVSRSPKYRIVSENGIVSTWNGYGRKPNAFSKSDISFERFLISPEDTTPDEEERKINYKDFLIK